MVVLSLAIKRGKRVRIIAWLLGLMVGCVRIR